jgi:hypothetical protein
MAAIYFKLLRQLAQNLTAVTIEMMMMSVIRIMVGALAICVGAIGSLSAQASFIASEDGETVYDSIGDVTWLSNANLAATKSFGVRGINPNGSMSWTTAQQWISAINAANYLGSNKWSLPTSRMPDYGCSQNPKSAAFGYGCSGSQMGNLYYNQLGGVKGSTIEQTHNASYSLFKNFQPYLYWSSTLWERVPNSAFSFSFGNGFQGTNVFANAMYAIPVAPGKVGSYRPSE